MDPNQPAPDNNQKIPLPAFEPNPSIQTPTPSDNQTTAQTAKKMVVGWFSFTCCEDNTIALTELLNDHLDEWKKIIEFRHLKALKTKNSLQGLDVAFIEGAISSDKQASDVQKIRDNAKYVVAVGACACMGMPSASRNAFSEDEIAGKIAWYLSHFDYSAKVRKLEEVVKVDDKVDGCPMNTAVFLEVMGKYLKLFNIA